MFADRRRLLYALAALSALRIMPSRRASAAESDFAAILRGITGGASVRAGRVVLDTPPLADNGHSVPVKVRVESPMTAVDYVAAISILAERNPRPLIATYHLGPRAGRAALATRVRLNGSQRLLAIAKFADGSLWSGAADVIVTESACLDDS